MNTISEPANTLGNAQLNPCSSLWELTASGGARERTMHRRETLERFCSGFFSFKNIFILYWGLADLQCYVSFKCIAKWISYTYIYIYIYILFQILSPYSLSEYWVEFPFLYSRSLLVMYFIYGSVYMLILNSGYIPSTPHNMSPLVTTSLFSKSLSLFPFCKYIHLYLSFFFFFRFHI